MSKHFHAALNRMALFTAMIIVIGEREYEAKQLIQTFFKNLRKNKQ